MDETTKPPPTEIATAPPSEPPATDPALSIVGAPPPDETPAPPPPTHLKHGPSGVRTAVEKGERPVEKDERAALLAGMTTRLDEMLAAKIIDRPERDRRRKSARVALNASCLFRCPTCDAIYGQGACPTCGRYLTDLMDVNAPEWKANAAKWDYDPATYRRLAVRLAADLLRVDGQPRSAWSTRAEAILTDPFAAVDELFAELGIDPNAPAAPAAPAGPGIFGDHPDGEEPTVEATADEPSPALPEPSATERGAALGIRPVK